MNRKLAKLLKLNSAEETMQKIMELIIDEGHPTIKPITDEQIVSEDDEKVVFSRDFSTGENQYSLTWDVYHGDGTEGSAKTVFHKAELK